MGKVGDMRQNYSRFKKNKEAEMPADQEITHCVHSDGEDKIRPVFFSVVSPFFIYYCFITNV